MLATINSRFETGIRSPLDAAILQHAAPDAAGYEKVDELPFDFERRRLSVVMKTPDDEKRRLLITKGAPESVLAVCTCARGEWASDAARCDLPGRRARLCTTG